MPAAVVGVERPSLAAWARLARRGRLTGAQLRIGYSDSADRRRALTVTVR